MAFFRKLHQEFKFSFDMAASETNTLLPRWYGIHHPQVSRRNGLQLTAREQSTASGWGFCNPPYSRGQQGAFIRNCAERGRMVMLLPARTDTLAFHKYIYDVDRHRFRKGVEVRFIKGRIKFGGATHGAPFPSMIVIFR